MKRINKIEGFRLRKLSVLTLSTLALLTPLMADAASHRKIVYIDQYDQNFDGKVSTIEFEMARRSRFDVSDANHNSVLDEQEYIFEWEDRMDAQIAHDRREQVEQTATRFDSLNNDGDEYISWEEFEASGEWSFARFDSNEDGVVSEDDIDGMGAMVAESDSGRTNEEILADQKRILVMPSTHSKSGTIEQYDRDGDGMATHEEFVFGRTAYFEKMDANGDGNITQEEYLFEFEDRMDETISRTRKESIEQANVRFNALDSNDDSLMTYKEYQFSGHRSFTRWDTDGDGFISYEETDPTEPEFSNDEDDEEQSEA